CPNRVAPKEGRQVTEQKSGPRRQQAGARDDEEERSGRTLRRTDGDTGGQRGIQRDRGRPRAPGAHRSAALRLGSLRSVADPGQGIFASEAGARTRSAALARGSRPRSGGGGWAQGTLRVRPPADAAPRGGCSCASPTPTPSINFS